LQAALAAVDVGPGDEVIVPPLTFFSTIMAVMQQGAIPVFCDISRDTYCMDAAGIAAAMTPNVKAVVPVHYFGHVADVRAIALEAKRAGGRKIATIEDAAQAHGSAINGETVGAIGDAGCYSFFATKHMTTGEGGAVTTNDDAIANYCRTFRSHGMHGRNDHLMMGYNYRMSELNAAIGLAQMDKIEDLNARRIAICQELTRRLADIDWITLPKIPNNIRHTYFWMHIEVDEEKLGMSTQDLIRKLGENGVEVRHRYVEPLYKQPVLNENLPRQVRDVVTERGISYKDISMPNVEAVVSRLLGLPNRPNLSTEEMDYIVKTLKGLGPQG